MAHLNLYVLDELAEAAETLRRDTHAAMVPLSRHVRGLLTGRGGEAVLSSDYFAGACGFLAEEIAAPIRPLPEAVADPDTLR